MCSEGDKITKILPSFLLSLMIAMSPTAWSATLVGQELKLVAMREYGEEVELRICRLANEACRAIEPAGGMTEEQWDSALRTDRGLARLRSGLKGALLVTSVGLGGWLSWIGGLSRWIGGSLAFMGAGVVTDEVGVSEFLIRDDLRHQALVVLFHPRDEMYSGFDDAEISELAQYLSLVASVENDIRSFQLGEIQAP